ncbi:MAG: L-histidine N(alpha)-methyltransferase [Pseudomonadota bacterium]
MDIAPALEGADHAAFAASILAGLQRETKWIDARWLYDRTGAKLFEAITNIDHYYLTRTETALLETHADAMADALGERVTIVEPGSGAALKVRPLLAALGERAAGYVPIDISSEQLDAVADEMAALYPELNVTGIAADFFRPFTMDRPDNALIFFPGSTVGNLKPDAALDLFSMWREVTGADRFLIGFDLLKDRQVLHNAYDDPAGVTAAFKKNLLQRINRELGADFDLRAFDFHVRFDDEKQAIEMGLVSNRDQTVTVAGVKIPFARGEAIHSEDSRKYTIESFAAFAEGAALAPVRTWTDPKDYFAVMLLEGAR